MMENASPNSSSSERRAAARKPAPRRAVLDLAPLELDCMNTLWPMGEGTVREIRDRLAERRPRAYTTIMTIMDRLARKGVVERRKSGRAYTYRPNLTATDARSQALAQVIENFFAGSKDALVAHLAGSAAPESPARFSPAHPEPQPPAPRARAAVASAASTSAALMGAASPHRDSAAESDPAERIDETLL
jgi:BlaI family transcriptional regulator, penicillinase repressor